ncbi:MAG: hypothetical protein JWP92_3745 [Caulobacter sp.]|nr:hypothetical protein [Caulobacter sp.]
MKAALFNSEGVAFVIVVSSMQGVIFTASHYGAEWREIDSDISLVDQVPNLADLPAPPETPLLT